MIVGNDVASYQGDINYDVYKNNTNFVIPKATEGVGFTDPKFKRNQSEARRVGIPLGYYHFARPDLLGNTPEAEADYFLSIVGALKEGEILCLDYEPGTQIQAHVEWCKKWLDRVLSKTGVKPLIYMSESVVNKLDWKAVVDAGYGLWIAKYTIPANPNATFNTGQWAFAAMYQWTSSQKVPGVLNGTGNVDGNVFYGDVVTFKKYGYKPVVTPPPTTNWEQKYKEEVAAHDKTKVQLAETKVSLESQISSLNTRIQGIKDFTAKA